MHNLHIYIMTRSVFPETHDVRNNKKEIRKKYTEMVFLYVHLISTFTLYKVIKLADIYIH